MVTANALAQEGQSLSDIIKYALENNPKIQSLESSWKSESFAINKKRSLPNPMVGYTFYGENIDNPDGPQKNKYEVSQEIPFPGKKALDSEIQKEKAGIAQTRLEEEKRILIGEIKSVYYDIYWVDRSLDVAKDEKDILEGLNKTARIQYESNRGSQQDVVRIQIELTKLDEQIILLEQNRKSLNAKISSLLGNENYILAPVGNLKPAEFTYNLDLLQKMAEKERPEIRMANFEKIMAEKEKTLSKLNYTPDFNFGVEYTDVEDNITGNSSDEWMAKIMVSIPFWFGGINSEIKEKSAKLESVEKAYSDVKNRTISQVKDLFYKIEAYKNIKILYETSLLSQLEQSFDAAKANYERGETDFINVLEAQRDLLENKLAYYRTVVDCEKTIAELEMVVGKDL